MRRRLLKKSLGERVPQMLKISAIQAKGNYTPERASTETEVVTRQAGKRDERNDLSSL